MNVSSSENNIWLVDLGFEDYESTLELQKNFLQLRIDEKIPNVLILVQHNHVITLGKSAYTESLLLTPEELNDLGISVYEVERGGDVTYHGPGQLVGYPICHLKGEKQLLSLYVSNLEEVMIKTLGEFGIIGARRKGFPGAWVRDRKVGSLGIAIRRWVAYHGFALNVNTNLSFFRFINPCGLDWRVFTSMAQILKEEIEMDEIIAIMTYHFSKIFQVHIERRNREDISETLLAKS